MSDNEKDRSSRHNNMSDSVEGSPIGEPKKYFDSLADKYLKASHILYIALAVCFVLTLIFNAKLLTYNNFSYLVRDLNSAIDLASENYNSIPYSNDELRVTKNFRGGVITASTNDMAIYTATGKKTLQSNEVFVSPQIAVSQKYAIIYDLGGNNYSIYNSFTRVHRDSLRFPISFVTVSENGWYAVVSKDSDHNAIVYLYDDDFSLRNTYYYAHKYVFSVSINDQASKIGIVTVEADVGGDKFSTFLDIYEPKNEKVSHSVRLGTSLPCGSSFNDKGATQVVCTDGIYTFDENSGSVINSSAFNEERISKISIGEFGCAVLTSNKGEIGQSTVWVFNKSGGLIFKTNITGGIFDMELFENHVFINQNNSILKINVKNGERTVTPVFDHGVDIIVYDNNNILLCCQTKAKYIKL